MDRRRVAGVLLALAACVAYATAAPTSSNHTSLDLYDGAPDGCYYNFQHYGEGDRIMTNEPCLNCTCHNRMLMCYLRVCPFTKPIGQDCTIEKRADQCCPIVTCPDVPVDLLTSTTTSPAEYGATGLGKLDKYGCSIHGKYFSEGSKVPPAPNKPCEHCYCIRNMTTCVMQECTLHVDGCTPIYHKDVCCPVRYSCDHPEDEMPLLDDLSTTVRPTPGFLLTTTTLSPVTQMSQDCLYENQIIPDGALIKTEKACDHCYCMKGDIVCVVQECGTPMENEGKNCTALAPRQGVCCPDTYICEGDEPTTGTYEGLGYTTELEQERLTTLSPPRRTGSEGSGYRNEPDDIPNTDSPAFVSETEGSGDELATIQPTAVTETLPDSHKIEPTDEISSSTEESHEFIAIATTKTPVSEYEDFTTISDKDIFETSTTKSQDEDIGSGEEDIIAPHEVVTTSSVLPAIEDSQPTVTGEQNVATTESNREDNSETHVKETTTSVTTVDKDRTYLEQSVTTDDSAVEITTEIHHHLDEQDNFKSTTTIDEGSLVTEHASLQTTTNVPNIGDDERKTTLSVEKDNTAVPGFEDEIATTESQDVIGDSYESTSADFDPHHEIKMTASTPLLEEIEKDTTDQENIPGESNPDKHKDSTILTNIPTEDMTDKDSLKPDLIDETISTNIPTIVSAFENDDVTTAEPHHRVQEAEVEESSEPQQYPPTTNAPAFDDEFKKTTPSDFITTSEPLKGHKINVEESSEPQQYSPVTSAPDFEDENQKVSQKVQETGPELSSEAQPYSPVTSAPDFEDEGKETTLSDSINITETQKGQETGVEESSEPEQYVPTTSAPAFEDESKETTSSDSINTSDLPKGQETDVKESSEPQQYAPTTSAPAFEDETKETTSSDSLNISEPQKGQETGVEESSEPEQYVPTTSAPAFEDESKETTSSDSINTSDLPKGQETDVKESSEPQQYAPTTSAPAFEDERKETTSSDSLNISEPQRGQQTGVEESSEPEQYVPTTSAPAFEDESKETTSSDSLNISEPQKGQETGVEESSEPEQYVPTTSAPAFEDESKETTSSDSLNISEPQKGQETHVEESSEPEQHSYTTSAPAFEEEIKKITPAGDINNTVSQDVDVPHEVSSETTYEQNEITTVEPDKGMNTIPSGSVEEEITESPEVSKYTHANKVTTTELATELENKISVETEPVTGTSKLTTSTPDTSTTREDQLTQTTESTENVNVDTIALTETHDNAEQTTMPANISKESTSAQTHPSSTKSPTSEYQETGSSPVPLITENIEQTADSREPITSFTYEPSTQATGLEDATSEKHETSTSSPSYATIPESTTTNLQENEIINEPRIPGEGDCLLNGVTYRNESAVPNTNKCQSGCRCSSSIIKCDPIICSPPPEYMDNCQTTYDAPDSCCPTYVCDHRTETMPPQSHSQMSGTEAPVVSSVECNGDECVLSDGKNQSVETSALCKSGSCTSQDETSSYPSIIPEQPVEYHHKECTGDTCRSSDSSDQLCSKENGCQASPVKPCEGTECQITSDTILPQKQQPCKDGDNCEVPKKDCSAGSCDSDTGDSKKPHDKICDSKEDCVDKLDIEKECTEQSCKRKDDSALEQPPKKCSGSDCHSTESTLDIELTTAASLATPPKEIDLEAQTKSTDSLDNVTEKIEKLTESPSTDSDRTGKPIENITEEHDQQVTTQSDNISKTKPLPTTTLPDLDSDKVEISTVQESATTSENQDITESSVPYLPESTKVSDGEIDTETPTYLLDKHVPEKEHDVTTETVVNVYTDSSDLYFDKDTVTEIAEKISTPPPKIHSTEQQETTKLPLEIDNQEITTQTEKIEIHDTESHDTTSQENEVPEDMATSNPEMMSTEAPITHHTELSAASKPVNAGETTTKTTDEIKTTLTYDTEPQEVTKSSIDNQNEETTTKKSTIYELEPYDVTKSPQGSEGEEASTKITEEIGSTPSKTYDSDLHEVTKSPEVTASEDIITHITDIDTSKPHDLDREGITKAPEEPQSEETTPKLADEQNKPEVPDVQEATKSPDGTSSDEITKHSHEELTTESLKPYDSEEKEVTKSPQEINSEKLTTSITEDMSTETSSLSDTEVKQTTQSIKETDNEEITKIPEEIVTETSKPHDIDVQKASPSSEEIESEVTKISAVTEPSTVVDTEEQKATKTPGAFEFTTIEVRDDTDKEPWNDHEISPVTTVPQQDETSTELPKTDEFEPLGITKSPHTFEDEETTVKITMETDADSPKSDEPQAATQSSEIESMSPLDITTNKSTEDEQKLPSVSHSLEKSTTSQPDIVSELTTLSISLPDSKSTEPDRRVYEMTTRIQEQSQPTESAVESATESIDKATTTSSISDQDILTKSPLDLVTNPDSYSDVTDSFDKSSSEDAVTNAPEISTSDVTISELPKEQDTKTPDEERKTTEAGMEFNEMTQKPVPISTSHDDKLQEDSKPEVPVLLETEKDILPEVTTSNPSDNTDEVNIKTEQPDTTDSTKHEQTATTLDETTENMYIAEKDTTAQPTEEPKTKLPFDSEIELDSPTEKPITHEHEPSLVEPSKMDTSGKDETETESPIINVTPEDEKKVTEKVIEIVKETETTQQQDIITEPTKSEGETYSKIPLPSSSEADTETSNAPEESVDGELTTHAIQIFETTTEPSKIFTNIPTESSGSQDGFTEKLADTTQKEPEVTEQIEIESSSSKDGAGDKETVTMVTEISTIPESSTHDQLPIEMHSLSTESPKEMYTEISEEKRTTEVITETEKISESVTESAEKITKDTEIKTPEQEGFVPLQPTATESAEQITKVQDQADNENVEVATDKTAIKDFDQMPASPPIIKTTESPEAAEASTKFSEMITSQPGDDIEKSTAYERPSSPQQEFPETTTSGKIEDERVSPVDTNSSEIPITVSDEQKVDIVTEVQPGSIDMATKKPETATELMEEDFIPNKTARPEMYPITLSDVEESEKSTASSVLLEEASISPDQTMVTLIESHVSDGEQSATTVVSEMDRATTPNIPEIEVQTEKITTTTEKPLQPESPETSAPEEEKPTTAKAEETSTASPVFDKFTKPVHKPTEAATEPPRPIPTEEQPIDDLLTPDEEPSNPPSGTSGYGTDPDYMEEDQTFGPGTCRYGGKVYVSAQQIPRDDPCDFCFCFRSDIICLQQSCPPPIHGCHEEPISGFCCPRYECPVSMATTVNVTTTTTTTTTTLPPHFPVHSYKGSAQKRGCLIKGHTYKVGEVVRASSGPCLHCTCGGDGQMKCDPKQCTPEPMLRQMIAAAVSAKRRR